jgi:hypothetical protein
MPTSDETAWQDVRAFGDALEAALGPDLRAAYVVDALAHGGYDPDAAPVTVTVVLGDDADPDAAEAAVARARHEITTGATRLRCVLLTERDLAGPFSPERETAPEVLRLADEGVRVVGQDLRDAITRPRRDDLLGHIRHYDRMIRDTLLRDDADEPPDGPTLYELTAAACRHHIFVREGLLIWRRADVLTAFGMGYHDHPASRLVGAMLRHGPTGVPHDARLARDVSAFWRSVHEAIH